MSDSFEKTWRGWIRSSQGYDVRVMGRGRVEYRDELGSVPINAEAMSSPWNEIVIYIRSIPDSAERPRALVQERLRHALEFGGFTLTFEDA